jgi:hypothetical protein
MVNPQKDPGQNGSYIVVNQLREVLQRVKELQ